jgi:hypothetical protein
VAAVQALSGKWRNQLGSELVLDVAPDGHLTGSFRSGVGTVPHDRHYPIAGFAAGDVVSFCVSFGSRGVATWIGQLTEREGVARLPMLWYLASDVPDPDEARSLWSSVRAGSDLFLRA